ncbi:MFS transporter [Mucilaginibacter sp. UC70_90]
MPANKLPLSKQLAYACGMIGWSIMTNIIIVMLPYFYLPPNNAGLTTLVPQLLLFGLFNIMSVITASGRLVDAFFDPFIASLSDKSENRRGRRIPFMQWAVLPAALFCGLTFYPMVKGEASITLTGLPLRSSVFLWALRPILSRTTPCCPSLHARVAKG